MTNDATPTMRAPTQPSRRLLKLVRKFKNEERNERRLRRAARACGEIVKRSRRALGEPHRNEFVRFLILEAGTNLVVDGDNNAATLLRRNYRRGGKGWFRHTDELHRGRRQRRG
jgi:hypothetical protein